MRAWAATKAALRSVQSLGTLAPPRRWGMRALVSACRRRVSGARQRMRSKVTLMASSPPLEEGFAHSRGGAPA